MQSMNNLAPTDHLNGTKSPSGPTPADVERWRSYLGICPDQSKLSYDHQTRLAFTKMFYQYQLDGAYLFHMTVTYKSYQSIPYSPKITNDFFINFYLKNFLPYLLGTKNIHKRRFMQPICFAFLDEHESVPTKMTKDFMFPEKLHHHAVLAVHRNIVPFMRRMLGENMIGYSLKYSSKVMTTHIRECDPMVSLYATKRLRQYPEYLVFPDRLH